MAWLDAMFAARVASYAVHEGTLSRADGDDSDERGADDSGRGKQCSSGKRPGDADGRASGNSADWSGNGSRC